MSEDKERIMTMREIGKDYGVTSHVVGKWLTRIGLREGGQPTAKAKQGGFCEQVCDRDRGIYFYAWNAKKTLAALEQLVEDCIKGKGATDGE